MKRLCFLLLSSLAFGQGVVLPTQQALKTVNGVTSPLPNATITVCAANTSGIPCSPVLGSALFKDAALTQPLTNPFTSDANGNYVFAIAPGNYTVTVTGLGFAGYSYQTTAPVSAAAANSFSQTNTFSGATNLNGGGSLTGTFSGPATFSGSNSFTGLQTFKNLSQIRIVNGPSDPNWSGADDGARVNSAIADNGTGQDVDVWLRPGAYSINTTIRISHSNVRIRCLGGGIALNGSNGACRLNWGGSVGGTVFDVETSNTVGIGGVMLEALVIDCMSSAATGIKWYSVYNGVVQYVQISNCTANNYDMGVNGSVVTNPLSTQNIFNGIQSQTNVASANGCRIGGVVAAGNFDSAFNTFISNTCIGGSNGDGMRIENSDNNRFFTLVTAASGTGHGVHLTCTASATSNNNCARESTFLDVDTGPSGILQDGNSGFYATANVIYGDELCNGTSVPSTSQITKGSAYIQTLDCGDANFGTYIFGVVGGNTLLNEVSNYATGWQYNVPVTLKRTTAGSSSMLVFDDLSANLAECAIWNESGTGKFQWCKDASSNFDLNNGTTNFVAVTSGGITQLQASPSQPIQMLSPTSFPSNTVALTADWTCGTGGTVASCTSATIIGSGGGVPLTFTLPLVAQSYTLECDGVVGQATAATANQWNLLTATNGATNVTANYSMATAATASAYGAVTDQASTTTTFQISPSWTLGGTGTKMPFHIWARIEGASVSSTVLSIQLVAPTVADLVTIYRGTSCTIF